MLVLTSSGFYDNNLYDLIIHSKIETEETLKTILITTAAIPEKENNKWVQETTRYLNDQNIKEISYFDFEYDEIETLLQYDIIVIMGGNPYELFFQARKANFQNITEELINKKTVIGISAGAMMFTKGIHYISEFNAIMNFKNKDNIKNINVFDGFIKSELILFPHYDLFCSLNENLENEICKIEKRDRIKITRLNNNEYIIIKKES